MSNNNTNKSHIISFPKDGDPYQLLNISDEATEAEISKSYKKLALKYHPDRLPANLSVKEKENYQHQFLLIKEARNFLLEDEFKEDLKKYISSRMAAKRRREADEVMDSKRRKMKDDLFQRERELLQQRWKVSQKKQFDSKANKKSFVSKQEQKLSDLEKEGQDLRAKYTERVAVEETEARQMRLKWKRKFIKMADRDTVYNLVEMFGTVSSIEFIGKKGNEALITFDRIQSVINGVEYYATDENIRGYYVSDATQTAENEDSSSDILTKKGVVVNVMSGSGSGGFNVDMKERQIKRDAYLRKMMNSVIGSVSVDGTKDNVKHDSDTEEDDGLFDSVYYPPPLPPLNGMTPLECLTKFEDTVLPKCF